MLNMLLLVDGVIYAKHAIACGGVIYAKHAIAC